MVIETSGPSLGLTVAAILGSGYLLSLMWHRRGEPTARPLVGLALVLFGTVTVHLFHVHLTPTHELIARQFGTEFAEVFWIQFVFVSYIAALGLWTVFVFEYTGRGAWVTRLVSAVVAGLVIAQVGVFALAAIGTAVSITFAEAVLGGTVLVVIVLAVVGIFLVIDESTRLGPLLLHEALILSGAAGTILASTWLFLTFATPPVYTGAVLLSSLLFVFAIRHYSMFESLPVASVLGRDRVVDEMAEAVVIVGQDETVQDVNPAAATLFDADRDVVVGASWSTLFPPDLSCQAVARTDQPVRLQLAESVLSVTASEIRDESDRLLGYLVVCQDVTDRREREQRLALLNRFLVETVSDRMDAVAENAESIGSDTSAERRQRHGDSIWTTTTNLITLLTHVREIERGLATDDEQRSDVNGVLDRVVESVAAGNDRPTLAVAEETVYAAIEPPLLESMLELLVTDGTQVRPEQVTVSVGCDGEAVDITLVPEGDEERAVTELEALAVQLARLTAEAAGGSLAVETTEANSETEHAPDRFAEAAKTGASTDAAVRAGEFVDRITVSLPAPEGTAIAVDTARVKQESPANERERRQSSPGARGETR